jgi:hypothetical protein
MRLSENQPQSLTAQPWDDDVRRVEPSGDQQWIVRSFLELYHDLTLGDHDICRGVDQVHEEVPGLGGLVTIGNAERQQSVEAAGHQRQSQGDDTKRSIATKVLALAIGVLALALCPYLAGVCLFGRYCGRTA